MVTFLTAQPIISILSELSGSYFFIQKWFTCSSTKQNIEPYRKIFYYFPIAFFAKIRYDENNKRRKKMIVDDKGNVFENRRKTEKDRRTNTIDTTGGRRKKDRRRDPSEEKNKEINGKERK